MSIQFIPGRGGKLRPDGAVEFVGGIVFKKSLSTKVDVVFDEDDMASDSNTALVTQQSVKAFSSHDRQTVVDQSTHVTTLIDTFEDIPTAILTAKDLGQEGNYAFEFSLIVQASSANTIASFRLLVNGTPESLPRALSIKTNNQDIGTTFLGNLEDIVDGDVLQAQWTTDKGTLTMSEFNIRIDGIPESRVIT